MAIPQEFHHVRERFKNEVDQHLNDAAKVVAGLDPSDELLLDRVARHLHAIKGSSPILGARAISEVARAAEEAIHLVHERPALWSPARARLLLECFDFMRVQVAEFVDSKPIDDGGEMIAKVHAAFPGAEEAARRIKAEPRTPAAGTVAAYAAVTRPGKRRVLFVDDSQIARELYKVFLVNRGYEVETAGDGNEALQRLKAGMFDVVITDDQMPEMDGTELLLMSRMEERLKNVPFVVISGKANEEARDKALEWGAAAYLIKGDFEKEHLLDILVQVLGPATPPSDAQKP